ncbi:nuclear transport factor 2 family protein [Sphingomonadales bacterium 56]|nr:nuclear transport factor 2 family protein [Sphingomonadales bacterium 56]MBY2959895.1 nuclear transport factor 2 family protein [Sphingomonadales bacterium 58]
MARMADRQRQLVRRFFDGLTSGAFDADLFADDLACWTTASGKMEARLYRAVPAMLKSIFPDGLAFHIDAIIAEGDRAAAEARSEGMFDAGQVYTNDYVFLFTFHGDRISSVAEHLNPLRVPKALAARMMAALSA